MNAASILNGLKHWGVVLSVKDGALNYRAPQGVLTPALRQLIASHRDELITLIETGSESLESGVFGRIVKEGQQLRQRVESALEWLDQNALHPSFADRFDDWRKADADCQAHEKIVQAFRSKGFVPIGSSKLNNEVVIFLRDENVQLPRKWAGTVTYTLNELDVLRSMAADDLLLVHDIKKLFGGRVRAESNLGRALPLASDRDDSAAGEE